MTLLSPNHNHAADECIAQIPQHHIPTAEEKVRASQSFNKSVLVAAHMAALHDAYILEMATHPVNEVTIKPSSPTSSIGGLKPSTLKQLKVGKVHRRRVVNGTLCVKTLCTKSHDGLMVVNVFEDEEGNALRIYLSNAMEGNGGSAQAQRLYPQGSKVAVKEPYLTRFPDGEIVLLVEKTTDLVFLWVPDYVEEKGTENGGSKDNEHYESSRDAFAAEKPEALAMSGADGTENEAVDTKKSNGDLSEFGVVEEGAKRAKASLEPKFEDVMNAKEERRIVEGAIDSGGYGKLQGSLKENVEVVPDGESNLSRDMNLEDVVAVKGEEEGKEEKAGAVDAASDVGSRELSLDDLLAMRKGEGDSRDGEEPEGEIKGNASQVHEAETREIEKEAVKEEVLNEDRPNESEPIQEDLEASPGHVDAGKALENASEVHEAETREIKKEEAKAVKEEVLNEGGPNESEPIQEEVEASLGHVDAGNALENASEVHEAETREIRKEEVKEKALIEGGLKELELIQGDVEASPGHVDASRDTSASLRAKGNALFARGDFNNASSVYSRGAEKARSDGLKMEEVLCLSNRAEVLLRLCHNQAALDDAEAALKLLRECREVDAGDLALAKALFRKGRALMGLHKYEDGMRVLQEVLAKAPADRMLREAALKCRRHLEHVLKPGKRQRAAANRKKSTAPSKQ